MSKLERKLQKIFSKNGDTSTTAYGSKAQGNLIYSKDLDVLQSDMWENGRASAIVVKGAAVLQDNNTIDYVLSSQIKYINQQGLCEYLSTETYYIGSKVKVIDTNNNNIVREFISLTDTNLGNDPLTDDGTNWKEISFFMNYSNCVLKYTTAPTFESNIFTLKSGTTLSIANGLSNDGTIKIITYTTNQDYTITIDSGILNKFVILFDYTNKQLIAINSLNYTTGNYNCLSLYPEAPRYQYCRDVNYMYYNNGTDWSNVNMCLIYYKY